MVRHEGGNLTKFLALDKVLPNRHFLQVLEFTPPEAESQTVLELRYDPTWLAILRITHVLDSQRFAQAPPEGIEETQPSIEDIQFVKDRYKQVYQREDLVIPDNFTRTQPAFVPDAPRAPSNVPSYGQTNELMSLLELDNLFHASPQNNVPNFAPTGSDSSMPCSASPRDTYSSVPSVVDNPEEIELDLEDDE